jgi:DNA-binding beta-propeller fold protein YncE
MINQLSLKSFLVVALLATAFLAGCAKTTKLESGYQFFPPPPAAPHIQYLTGITSSADVEEQDTSVSIFVTGAGSQSYIKKIGKANGIAIHQGKLYVTSTSFGQVVIIDFLNKSFDYLKGNVGPGKLSKPVSLAFDEAGNLYVVDTGREQIVVYNPAGEFLRALRREAIAEKEDPARIVDLAFFKGRLYALDNRASLVRILDPETGAQLDSFGQEEADVTNRLGLPYAMTITREGYIFVTNIGTGRVLKFDTDGNFLEGYGRIGDSPGEFARPRGVAVADNGQIYVVDAGFQNVQVFNEDGRMLGYFGTPGRPAGSLNLPSGIAVSTEHLDYFQKLAAPGFKIDSVIYVTNQFDSPINPVISIYGHGQMESN